MPPRQKKALGTENPTHKDAPSKRKRGTKIQGSAAVEMMNRPFTPNPPQRVDSSHFEEGDPFPEASSPPLTLDKILHPDDDEPSPSHKRRRARNDGRITPSPSTPTKKGSRDTDDDLTSQLTGFADDDLEEELQGLMTPRGYLLEPKLPIYPRQDSRSLPNRSTTVDGRAGKAAEGKDLFDLGPSHKQGSTTVRQARPTYNVGRRPVTPPDASTTLRRPEKPVLKRRLPPDHSTSEEDDEL